MVPAEPGQLYFTVASGALWMNRPDFNWVTFADLGLQQVIQSDVVHFDNNGDTGYTLAANAGWVLPEPIVGRKNWVDLKFSYGKIDSDEFIPLIDANGADVEFISPVAGGGFTLLAPADLRNVMYMADCAHYGAVLDFYVDLLPSSGGVTITPLIGFEFERIESDTDLTLESSFLDVARVDRITSNGGGLRLGGYVSKPIEPFTLYGGVHVSGLYANADGYSTLTGVGGGNNIRETKDLSEDGFVFKAGGTIGVRFEPCPYASVQLEGGLDFTNGAIAVDYPPDENSSADLDFNDAWGGRLDVRVMVHF